MTWWWWKERDSARDFSSCICTWGTLWIQPATWMLCLKANEKTYVKKIQMFRLTFMSWARGSACLVGPYSQQILMNQKSEHHFISCILTWDAHIKKRHIDYSILRWLHDMRNGAVHRSFRTRTRPSNFPTAAPCGRRPTADCWV
jgi:hypothetical protein